MRLGRSGKSTENSANDMTHSNLIENLRKMFLSSGRTVSANLRFQKIREKLLKEMLRGFNKGRSKNYCVATAALEIEELSKALSGAKERSKGLEMTEKAKVLHSMLDAVAESENCCLKLRR